MGERMTNDEWCGFVTASLRSIDEKLDDHRKLVEGAVQGFHTALGEHEEKDETRFTASDTKLGQLDKTYSKIASRVGVLWFLFGASVTAALAAVADKYIH